jgi:hypothetical protein
MTDQRGVSRPQGSGCDVGAYEAQETPAQLLDELASDVEGVGPGTSLADKNCQGAGIPCRQRPTDTCVTLSAFINQVNAQLGRSIPPPTAIEFTAQASRIKTMLSCGP